MSYLFFDPTYFWWVFIPTLLISFGVQMHLRRTFKKWSKVGNQADLTGDEVAQELFDEQVARADSDQVDQATAGRPL